MNLDDAAGYWKQRLTQQKPIYRVRVRRLLELAGAERRGWAIMRRIGETLDSWDLTTEPDFRTAWIDALVNVRLKGYNSLQPNFGNGNHLTADTFNGGPVETEIDQDGIDPCAENEIADGSVPASVAEALNSSAEDVGVVETPLASPIDAVIRVSSIPSANRGVVSVFSTDPITKATTTMIFERYSQLAIMQGEREVRGMISWESIAKGSLLPSEPKLVADCRVDAQVIEADGSLFDALPTIERFGYVLVRSKDRKITGIVTATDLAVELGSISYAFMKLRTIEMLIRNKLHSHVSVQDLTLLEEHSRARLESDPGLMTFGENIRLLENNEIWQRLLVNIDKGQFTKRLLEIRDIRNDVMHFDPDPLGVKQKKNLEQMEEFLRQVFI